MLFVNQENFMLVHFTDVPQDIGHAMLAAPDLGHVSALALTI